jgi:hypothetical protein
MRAFAQLEDTVNADTDPALDAATLFTHPVDGRRSAAVDRRIKALRTGLTEQKDPPTTPAAAQPAPGEQATERRTRLGRPFKRRKAQNNHGSSGDRVGAMELRTGLTEQGDPPTTPVAAQPAAGEQATERRTRLGRLFKKRKAQNNHGSSGDRVGAMDVSAPVTQPADEPESVDPAVPLSTGDAKRYDVPIPSEAPVADGHDHALTAGPPIDAPNPNAVIPTIGISLAALTAPAPTAPPTAPSERDSEALAPPPAALVEGPAAPAPQAPWAPTAIETRDDETAMDDSDFAACIDWQLTTLGTAPAPTQPTPITAAEAHASTASEGLSAYAIAAIVAEAVTFALQRAQAMSATSTDRAA